MIKKYSGEKMKADYMPGNPQKKKKLIIGYMIVFLFITLFRLFALPGLAEYLYSKGKEEAISILTQILALVILCSIPIGIVLIRMGYVTRKERQFPPTKSSPINDTRIYYGKKANRIGLFIILLGCFLIGLCLIAAGFAYFILPEIVLSQSF
jgi:hypothetical protein